MKALVITEKDRPVKLQSVADKVAAAGQALVRVHAAALNHRDVWIQKGQYAGLKYPIIPGSDGAGVVEAVGPAAGLGGAAGAGGSVGFGAVTGGLGHAGFGTEWIGREVIIDPALDWGHEAGFQDPAGFRILGLPDDGTLAEYVVAPLGNLVVKPAHLSFTEAAALPLAGVTAWRALMTRGRLQAGERVLITGIGGGVALFALQYAVALGARVYVSSGSDEKLARARKMGAVGGVNYNTPGWVDELKGQAGAFDVIVDGAGGDGVNDLLDLATPGGRLVFYGATRGNPSSLVWRRVFWKQLNVLGSTMGNPEDFAEMVEFVGRHGIRPVVDRVFGMDEGEAAFRHMDAAAQFGKIVIKI
ncbi:MAG TPA: zinc-binding dehydrogenase [Puia sp.]|uniref:zinc-binding dehydrogenase n=1 Tax=Puia sp. TaxID=2045100 RepID=UPI002CEC2C7E|nr:zinc-binding dehydrogenase [Puia sp.]HVU93756.1 zinc-binding dehydrogenase [Puia sp.]